MKRSSLFLSLFSVLCLSIAGCGGDERSAEQQPSEPTTEEGTPPVGSTEEQPEPGDGQVQAQGKQCWANCTVQSIGGGSCPATISGYGNTTFLGGCNKACNKAQGDAAAKLPAGCVINTCSFSGC
ncbi:hypothetical protein [Archangium sp. Cb G35]|uniref:hypothetical protein n=1 Tax=Archangium sp. Cb G35 TaxID=1920190 RepID=UPI000ACC71C2|nr:hypothetical protein [Archangium sp. Cb G35]